MSALPQTQTATVGSGRVRSAALPLHIPSPRPPSDRATRAEVTPAIRIPSPRVPADMAGPAAAGKAAAGRTTPGNAAESGRHRAVVVRTSRTDQALMVAGRVGSLATLAALLVMSAAFAGVLDGSEPTGPAAQVATTTLH